MCHHGVERTVARAHAFPKLSPPADWILSIIPLFRLQHTDFTSGYDLFAGPASVNLIRMSTFRGIVAEFPRIRIDYFRQQPEHKPPLACFLSHVHSDHLTGLEALRAPFVYCSAATREILLRLEKRHYRVNFAKGLLESRNITYDRSMRKLAKPLPLDTPTTIELSPGNRIRVTCIDANHCIGAVMFLIEGSGEAILYTGDIRAEVWWVNSLVQNPILLPYTLGSRRLDCIYLDTTFATNSDIYREFSSKAAGIQELLARVSEYSADTVFYFHAWTFGYENVWIALANFLESRIHLDEYRANIYGSLSTLGQKQLGDIGLNILPDNQLLRDSGQEIREASALCGFRNGNHIQPGCLTSLESARIHSCERGTGCRIVDDDVDARIVHIIPIVTRTNETEVAELGAGGGHGDLHQKEELETGDVAAIEQLRDLCTASIEDEDLRTKVLALLKHSFDQGNGKLDISLQAQNHGQDDPSLPNLVSTLLSRVSSEQVAKPLQNRTIQFPYSRHSSYSELRGLLAAFRPMDVYPCTVDTSLWKPESSMHSLFGDLCSGNIFRHDVEMMNAYDTRQTMSKEHEDERSRSISDASISDDDIICSLPPKRVCPEGPRFPKPVEIAQKVEERVTPSRVLDCTKDRVSQLGKIDMSVLSDPKALERPQGSPVPFFSGQANPVLAVATSTSVLDPIRSTKVLTGSWPTTPKPRKDSKRSKLSHKEIAYNAAIGDGLTWTDYGGLVSTRSKADQEEQEL